MSEEIPTEENSAERIHTEREILNIFEEITNGDFEIFRSLEDDDGLYMLEVETKGESGDKVLYTYIRAGKYPEGSSSETVIDIIYFEDEIPVGGHPITKYIDDQWVKEST